MIHLPKPLCLLGCTPEGKPVLGGAFQMADTKGIPLSISLDQARKWGMVISIPHYFASAIEHGWDQNQIQSHVREGFVDSGEPIPDFMDKCFYLLFEVARKMEHSKSVEVGKKMREMMEAGESIL